MRIVSKFKDYYDFVGQKFGEDPGCLYLRGLVSTAKDNWKDKHKLFAFRSRHDPTSNISWDHIYIVAGAYFFPMARGIKQITDPITKSTHHEYGYRFMDEKLFDWIGTREHVHPRTMRSRWMPSYNHYPTYIERINSPDYKLEIRRLIVSIGSPVFKITEHGIDEKVPVLEEHGIPSQVEPEQMWQNIYTIMTSVLRRDPDKDPPVALANNERIQKAGFDLKSSFRHPVNEKKPRREK